MKRIIHQSIAFACACALTAFVWHRQVPSPARSLPAETRGASKFHPPAPLDVDALIRELKDCDKDETRLRAALRFNEIPISQVREALERIPLIEDRKITFPAKLLLMRLAGAEGEEAAEWAWIRFRAEGVWNDAFKEIIAAWAWRKPEELVAWTRGIAGRRKAELGNISMADANQSNVPILDFGALNQIAWSLIQVSPRQGYEAFKIRGGMSTDDSRFADSLQSVAAVQEALTAFEDLDQLRADRMTGTQMNAMSLMYRWKKIDPEDFARSPYAHLVPDSSSYKAPPIPDGPKGWQREFEEESHKHRGEVPETKDWPQEKQEAWKDFQTLQSFRRKDRL